MHICILMKKYMVFLLLVLSVILIIGWDLVKLQFMMNSIAVFTILPFADNWCYQCQLMVHHMQ